MKGSARMSGKVLVRQSAHAPMGFILDAHSRRVHGELIIARNHGVYFSSPEPGECHNQCFSCQECVHAHY